MASDTAGMITLYYKEQIQSIDSGKKIKGSNAFNEKVRWIKDYVRDVRPESAGEMAVVMVAEYVTSWVIDALKAGKSIIQPTQSLPQQFWLYVAKQNPLKQSKALKATDTIGYTAGEQLIPLKIKTSRDTYRNEDVQLRFFIGGVSVINSSGDIYQSRASGLNDLEIYGYVYVTPFSSDTQTFQTIVVSRNLKEAKRDPSGNILTNFNAIIELAQTYAAENDEHTNKTSIAHETVSQVVELLEQNKTFVNAQHLRDELKKVHDGIVVDIDVLREDFEEKRKSYQTSIDAAHEQIKEESITNRETMQKDNQAHYERISNKFNEKLNDIEKYLNEQMNKRLNDIEKDLREKMKEILAIVETAKHQSFQAIEEAHQATQSSQRAAQEAAKAAINAQNLVESTEERRREFQSTASNCDTTVRQTVASLRQFFEKTVSDMRTKVEDDVTRATKAVREASNSAKESAASAREVQRITNDQIEIQKKETDKTLAANKDIRLQCEKAAADAREAEKQAKRAADTATTALNKVETALEQLEKLRRKLQ